MVFNFISLAAFKKLQIPMGKLNYGGGRYRNSR
jgi:hypothetical protein